MAITSHSESFMEKAFEFIWEQMQAVKVEDMGVPEVGWLDNGDGMDLVRCTWKRRWRRNEGRVVLTS